MLFQAVKKLCMERGTSIRQLEEKLEFSRGSIDKWKTSTPSIDKVQKVANEFNVTVDYLLRS